MHFKVSPVDFTWVLYDILEWMGIVNSSLAMLKHKLQFVHTHVGIIPDFSGLNRVEAKLSSTKATI